MERNDKATGGDEGALVASLVGGCRVLVGLADEGGLAAAVVTRAGGDVWEVRLVEPFDGDRFPPSAALLVCAPVEGRMLMVGAELLWQRRDPFSRHQLGLARADRRRPNERRGAIRVAAEGMLRWSTRCGVGIAEVVDVSRAGLRFLAGAGVRLGDVVAFEVPGCGRVSALVVGVSGGGSRRSVHAAFTAVTEEQRDRLVEALALRGPVIDLRSSTLAAPSA